MATRAVPGFGAKHAGKERFAWHAEDDGKATMRQLRRGLVATLLVVGVCAPNAAFADWEDRDRGDNVVSVENYRDGRSVARSRTSVAIASGDTVANENVASAYASCTDCRTVATAVQVLVVDGSPSDFRPVNLAVALNEECLRCQTFAYARQIVIRSEAPFRLGDDAEDDIEDIEGRIGEVTRSRRSFPEMTATLDRLAERMASVVRAEIARSGPSGGEDDRRDVHEDHDD